MSTIVKRGTQQAGTPGGEPERLRYAEGLRVTLSSG